MHETIGRVELAPALQVRCVTCSATSNICAQASTSHLLRDAAFGRLRRRPQREPEQRRWVGRAHVASQNLWHEKSVGRKPVLVLEEGHTDQSVRSTLAEGRNAVDCDAVTLMQ